MKTFHGVFGWSWILLAAFLGWVDPARAATEVANTTELKAKLGLDVYDLGALAPRLESLKIAILDNGFAGFRPRSGQLPPSAELIEGPANPQASTNHGLGMAQIIWALTGKPANGPTLYLVNANGFTNFKAAVDFVVSKHVDIVLYSQVWPFGSNFDGRGFINEAVSRATRAGILWVNAAGNFGGSVHEGQISGKVDGSSRYLRFSGGKDYLTFENQVDENEVTLTLSWTDFADSELHNSTKDLDVLVYDSKERLVGSSELIQRGEAPPATGESKLSSYSRESVRLRGLDRGEYRIRVRAQSTNFSATDRFRVLLEPGKPGTVELSERTPGAEIFAPADHPSVLTIGEDFVISSKGLTADRRAKPDAVLESAVVSFTNGTTVRGSSTAAALATASIAVMKAARPQLSSASVLAYARTLLPSPDSVDRLTPASPTAWPPIPSAVAELVPEGGRLMIHPSGRYVILVPGDPIELPLFKDLGASRRRSDDVLAYDPKSDRWMGAPRESSWAIRAPFVEFRSASGLPTIWRIPGPSALSRL